jgi:hypothetical protein
MGENGLQVLRSARVAAESSIEPVARAVIQVWRSARVEIMAPVVQGKLGLERVTSTSGSPRFSAK